jgi:GNAT superfamily N-acetyltransferase
MILSTNCRIELCPPGIHGEQIHAVLNELREALDLSTFEHRWRYQHQYYGYEVVVAWLDEEAAGVMGMRPVETFSRGAFLHIDDLVVRHDWRRRGIGRALLHWGETWATAHGLDTVFLDSRIEALSFYQQLGYNPHGSVLVRKILNTPST